MAPRGSSIFNSQSPTTQFIGSKLYVAERRPDVHATPPPRCQLFYGLPLHPRLVYNFRVHHRPFNATHTQHVVLLCVTQGEYLSGAGRWGLTPYHYDKITAERLDYVVFSFDHTYLYLPVCAFRGVLSGRDHGRGNRDQRLFVRTTTVVSDATLRIDVADSTFPLYFYVSERGYMIMYVDGQSRHSRPEKPRTAACCRSKP